MGMTNFIFSRSRVDLVCLAYCILSLCVAETPKRVLWQTTERPRSNVKAEFCDISSGFALFAMI